MKYATNSYQPDLKPDDIDDIVALTMGQQLYKDFCDYLNGENSRISISIYYPCNKFSRKEIVFYTYFYNNDTNKKWLGRQYYLYTSMKELNDYPIWEEGILFFNWLTNRHLQPTFSGKPLCQLRVLF